MDFNDTPQEAAYRQKVRTWLEANAPRSRDANDDGEGGGDLSAARVAASEALWFASKENIQTHGGMGFTWEVDCHLYYRRSRQLGLVAGAPKVWKERLVSHLERRNAA